MGHLLLDFFSSGSGQEDEGDEDEWEEECEEEEWNEAEEEEWQDWKQENLGMTRRAVFTRHLERNALLEKQFFS